MESISISTDQILIFLVVFLRTSALLFASPLFGGKNVPGLAKIGLALALSLSLYFVVSPTLNLQDKSLVNFGLGIVGEVLIGLILGFAVRIFFTGIQLAGQLVGFQMGMSIANVLDPATSNQVSVMAQLNYIVAFLIFLSINAHHIFIRAISESFFLVPPMEFLFDHFILEKIVLFADNIFIIAIKIGAPVIATLLLASVTFGLIARTVPQIHIFIISMPIQILIGLSVTALVLPFFVAYLKILFVNLEVNLFNILKAFN